MQQLEYELSQALGRFQNALEQTSTMHADQARRFAHEALAPGMVLLEALAQRYDLETEFDGLLAEVCQRRGVS